MTRQPWIGSAAFDGAFILGPALAVTVVVLAFPGFFSAHPITPAIWVVLVLGVDVSHVYSTLYRTYFDREEFARRRSLYVAAPLLGWLGFACLYSVGDLLFWRALAYLAVFHFIRQQYGFMMIYARREPGEHRIDRLAIYAATLLPLLWWHTHPRPFSWFVPGDFLLVPIPFAGTAIIAAYAAIAALYIAKEARLARFNWPRNLLLAGTTLSWWVGIVALDSDLAFTALNVLAHGIPYIALIWRYGRTSRGGAGIFSLAAVPLFLGLPMLLAYLEEGAWDGMIWRDHPQLFAIFSALPIVDDPGVLTWLMPLLALPQITHYLLDGFIWRVKGGTEPALKTMLA